MEKEYDSPHQILERLFGYRSFRGAQESVIAHTLAGKDSLVIMPTGGGKSLCYQIPALLFSGLTVVVSPLLALMRDQVTALQANGIAAAYLNSMLNQEESRSLLDELERGEIKLLYLSPERLLNGYFLSWLEDHPPALFAIDEAHCISTWGHDFRPEYNKLTVLKNLFPSTPMIALTATADKASREDILSKLQLKEHELFLDSFARDNIHISLLSGRDRFKQIAKYLSKHEKESGIIYCLSRKSCEDISEKLKKQGFQTAYFHAGMTPPEKMRVQEEFSNDKVKVICATIAFGMGIDKSNVRFVLHYNMPKNIEGYYQEIGRAGRDGAVSEAILFASYADVVQYQGFIEKSEAQEEQKFVQREKLKRMFDYTLSGNCRRNFLLNYFGEFRVDKCGNCDNCQQPKEEISGTILAQKALSGVYRTEERVGVNLLIDILRGSFRQEVQERGYHLLKTYGVGKDLSFQEWESYIMQFVNQGFLELLLHEGKRLSLTPLAGQVLKGEMSVSLIAYQEKKRGETVSPSPPSQESTAVDKEVFESLRSLRKELAEADGIPPYLVFSDKSLKEMASELPQTKAQFLQINGVGEFKLEKYGEDFLEVLKEKL